MCGESWLAVKDSLPTAPVPKAGHLGSCSHVVLCFVHCMVCIVFCFVFVCVILVCDGGGGDSFLPFLISLSGWYATYHVKIKARQSIYMESVS